MVHASSRKLLLNGTRTKMPRIIRNAKLSNAANATSPTNGEHFSFPTWQFQTFQSGLVQPTLVQQLTELPDLSDPMVLICLPNKILQSPSQHHSCSGSNFKKELQKTVSRQTAVVLEAYHNWSGEAESELLQPALNEIHKFCFQHWSRSRGTCGTGVRVNPVSQWISYPTYIIH